MRLFDITNSYSHLVSSQLANTDAKFVRVYSLGRTTVVYSQAPTHNEILLTNESRNIQDAEIDYVLQQLTEFRRDQVAVINGDKLAEISVKIPVAK